MLNLLQDSIKERSNRSGERGRPFPVSFHGQQIDQTRILTALKRRARGMCLASVGSAPQRHLHDAENLVIEGLRRQPRPWSSAREVARYIGHHLK